MGSKQFNNKNSNSNSILKIASGSQVIFQSILTMLPNFQLLLPQLSFNELETRAQSSSILVLIFRTGVKFVDKLCYDDGHFSSDMLLWYYIMRFALCGFYLISSFIFHYYCSGTGNFRTFVLYKSISSILLGFELKTSGGLIEIQTL